MLNYYPVIHLSLVAFTVKYPEKRTACSKQKYKKIPVKLYHASYSPAWNIHIYFTSTRLYRIPYTENLKRNTKQVQEKPVAFHDLIYE